MKYHRYLKFVIVVILLLAMVACNQGAQTTAEARIGSDFEAWKAAYGEPTRDNGITQGFKDDFIWVDFNEKKVAFGAMIQFGKSDKPIRSDEETDEFLKEVLPTDIVLLEKGVEKVEAQYHYNEYDYYSSETLTGIFGEGRIKVGKTVLTDKEVPGIASVTISYKIK